LVGPHASEHRPIHGKITEEIPQTRQLTDVDHAVPNQLDLAFGSCPRPKKFTIEDGDPWCMDADWFWHASTPETLKPNEIYSQNGYLLSHSTELLEDGFQYFLPGMARVALLYDLPEEACCCC